MPQVVAAGIGTAATEGAVAIGWFEAGSVGAAMFGAGVTIVTSCAIASQVKPMPGCVTETLARSHP